VNNFTGKLIVEHIDDGKRWRVVHGFTYRVGDPNSEMFVTIPRDFVTDFASFPLGIVFQSPGGKWDKAAVVHDLLYRRGWIERARHRVTLTRKDCDDIFRDAMQVAGVGWFPRHVIYLGVRLGGSTTWNTYRRADVEKARVVAGGETPRSRSGKSDDASAA
jgi:hypothetical protein